MVAGEIKLNEADLCSTILRLNARDVHVAGRARAKLNLVAIRADVDFVAGVVIVSGESISCARRLTDGLVPTALDDVAVMRPVPAVEGLDRVGGVRSLEAGGLHAEVKVTEVQVDVGSILVLAVVLLDGHGAGVSCQTDAGNVCILVGPDVHGAERRTHLHVVSIPMLVVGDAAAGEEKAGDGGKNRQSKRIHRVRQFQMVHDPEDLSTQLSPGTHRLIGRIRRERASGSVT